MEHEAWGDENCVQTFVEQLKRNKLLRRPRHRWDDNIKAYLLKVQYMAWTVFILLRKITVGGFCEHGNETCNSMTMLEVS